MPTDQLGDKWACEACVRGHRATRCLHFDRWMVRVKKPGRPLQNCPHATGPCSCGDEKVVMIRVPISEEEGKCLCRVLRPFDPTIDDENAPPSLNLQPSQQPLQIQDPSDPMRMVPYPNFQPMQQFPGPFNGQYQAFRQHIMVVGTSAGTANGQDMRAEPSRGFPLQNATRPYQPASDPSSSDQATPAEMPMTPTRGGQVPHQERSKSVAQAHSLISVQGDGFSRQVGPDSNVYSSLQLRPGQLDAANLQPQFAPSSPYQPVMSSERGQQTGNIPTFVQSPNPNTRYEEDPARPMTLAPQLQFQQLSYQSPEPRDPFPMISAAGPSAALNALTGFTNCQCGLECKCLWCKTHPYNDATKKRVQDLSQIMVMDNYWSTNHLSRPQTGYGAAPTNGTNIQSVMGQGHPPLDKESSSSAAPGWTNAPLQGPALQPALQPTFDEGASVDHSDHSNEFSPRTMRNSAYLTMEYPVNVNCTAAPGTCLCGSDCRCLGCLTHQGHTGLPN